MRDSLLDMLVDPDTGERLALEAAARDGDDVVEGRLVGRNGRWFPVTAGIARFVPADDSGQRQVQDSFGFKWNRRGSYDSPEFQKANLDWMLQRYGFDSREGMRDFFARRPRVLDAGCGAAFSSSLWLDRAWQGNGSAQWFGVDISQAIDVARQRLQGIPGTHFVQADLMRLPFRGPTFDAVFSEGVLHHTPSTEAAFGRLASLLAPGGSMLFYVYRKKAPIREFADDFIRDAIADMEPEQAWEALRPLTRLGQALAELKVDVDVPEDIPFLGIKAGRHDIQRFLYWHVAKMYWRDTFSFEENHHVNFDWYHPRYAHRHTEEEIRRWCADAGLRITRLDQAESGFTVRADRN